MHTIHYFAILLSVILPTFTPRALADLPLTVEDLVTEKGKLKLDASLAYANVDSRGVSANGPITVQTGPTAFVTLPTVIGDSISNSDSLVATLGLRYGLTTLLEIYTRTSFIYNSIRSSDSSGASSSNGGYFADAWAGLNYQLKKDNDTPAVLGFSEVALREKYGCSSSSFRSFMLGLTTYKAIDPIVFSLTVAYQINKSRKNGNFSSSPGNVLLFSPSVGFAVNDRTTLTTGLQWTNRQAETLNKNAQGIRRTKTDLLLAVGYGFTKGNTLNVTLNENASGQGGADLRVSWLRTF